MKIQMLLGPIIIFFVATSEALRCYTCENQPDVASCLSNGELKDCQPNENACETHVRRDGEKELIFKQCKQALACVNNEIQNPRAAATPVQCNDDGLTSVCRCCCYRDGCGANTLDCSEGEVTTIQPPPATPLCDQPEPFDFGVIDCGLALPNGYYRLRHRCELYCDLGFELEEGARDFITCRRDPNDATKGVWLPAEYPFCFVEEVTPGCETPPLWENGIVACVDPREDGRWELGDVCDYICPEGSTLVGAEQAECQVIDDFAFFGPDHPCCEPDCDPNQPTDILFVLDHSTSITAARWPIITSFANSIIEAFDIETVHFGVVVYGRGVLSELNIPFDFTNDKNILTAAVTAIPYDNPLPGTFTVEALNFARTDGFSAAFGDRVDARNLVIFVTDGVSFDSVDIGNGLTTLDLAADFLHGVADVFSVGVGNFNLDELLTIASNDDFVATTTDFGKLNDLIDDVTTIACPVQCPV